MPVPDRYDIAVLAATGYGRGLVAYRADRVAAEISRRTIAGRHRAKIAVVVGQLRAAGIACEIGVEP